MMLFFLLLSFVAQSVESPTVVWRHPLYAANSEMLISVRIIPHDDIRTVILEAWEVNEEERLVLRRSSIETATEGRKYYSFMWRTGLPEGAYHLIGRVLVARGISYGSSPVPVIIL